MEKVSVVRCKDYNEDLLRVKVNKLFDLIGGIGVFVRPGQNVLLKVNLLMDKPPEAMITTHPALVKVIAQKVKDAGATPIIGDSPGGPFNRSILDRAYQVTGLADAAREAGAKLNYNTEQTNVSYDGTINKSFVLGKFITEADVIINIAKLKTHGLTMITGAVKNLFGAIPGLLKAEYHLKMPRIEHFSETLVDLSLCVQPTLNIVDGIWGMEGEGPSSGDKRNFGYLLASNSPYAVDVAVAYLLGLTPVSKAPIIKAAGEKGLTASLDDVELLGDKLKTAENVKIPQAIQSSNLLDRKLPDFLVKILEPLLKPRPVFIHDKCIGCGDCFRSCPPGVITMEDKKPVVSLENCIRCFCCQELCQYQAVEIKRPLLGNLLAKYGDKIIK
ncbi:MAG: DUF362 domain-containing protein [Halanaerobiales bacterium]